MARRPLPASIRERRRIRRLIPRMEARVKGIFAEKGRSFNRVFASKEGKYYGVSIRPGSYPAEKYVYVFQVHPADGRSVQVARALLTFRRGKVFVSNVQKPPYFPPFLIGGWLPSRMREPRGLDVMRPILDTIIPYVRSRGVMRVELEAMNRRLVDYYSRFGFHLKGGISGALVRLIGYRLMELDIKDSPPGET